MADVNTNEMLKFYENFDAIDFKYSLDKGKGEYIKEYSELEEIELMYQFMDLNKIEYGDILTNLDMIYAEEEQSDHVVMLFDLIRKKIIGQYINIEGLERLFSEKYIDFEWDMHLGIDYKKHRMSFYRDHFVHQIRNAYCMHVLLKEFEIDEMVEKILCNQNNSKISQFVFKYIEQQKVWEEKNISRNKIGRNINYYKYIIYMTSYMSALFHDIGYPEVNHIINQRRITEYIANLYNAGSSGYDYPRLNSLLQNSLLFRIVPFKEIQKRLSSDKPDHGTLSAIVFLLNFYENGAIHGLQPCKRCAVELAALAIYNHTNHYRYNNCNGGDYVRCMFVLNPLSYLLRLCDDIQEWDRIYFELSNQSNLILCNTCKTPIFRKKIQKKEKLYNKNIIEHYYICNCNYLELENKGHKQIEENGIFKPIFEYSRNFPYRRIYNVSVCENLKIEREQDVLCFSLEYKLDKLLHIAYMNVDYAKYRISELNLFKLLLDYQNELPLMKIKYFMTANPILIKMQIVGEYFHVLNQESENTSEYFDISKRITDFFESYKETVSHEKERNKNVEVWKCAYDNFLILLEEKMSPVIFQVFSTDSKYDVLRYSVKKMVRLYLQLLLFMELHKRCNQNRVSTMLLKEKAEEELKYVGKQNREVQELVADCWKQFERMYFNISAIRSNPPKYYEQFETSDYTYGCIKRFVSTANYNPVMKEKQEQIDAYTDFGLIQTLLQKIYV